MHVLTHERKTREGGMERGEGGMGINSERKERGDAGQCGGKSKHARTRMSGRSETASFSGQPPPHGPGRSARAAHPRRRPLPPLPSGPRDSTGLRW